MAKDSYVDRMHFARRLVIQISSEATTQRAAIMEGPSYIEKLWSASRLASSMAFCCFKHARNYYHVTWLLSNASSSRLEYKTVDDRYFPSLQAYVVKLMSLSLAHGSVSRAM